MRASFLFLQTSSHLNLAHLVGFVSTAVFDVFVVVLTVFRTASLAWQSREVGIRRSLSYIMLRDGLYPTFFVMQLIFVKVYCTIGLLLP